MSEETKELALELRNAVEITKGNEETSIPENSSHSYAAWTTYTDYTVKIKDEFLQKHPDIAERYEPLVWHTSYYNGDNGRFSCSLGDSSESEMINPKKISIEDIPEQIGNGILKEYLPQCDEEDSYCFLYGKEKGQETYRETCWIRDHIMGDENVTRVVVELLGGHFEFNGQPYRHDRSDCYPIIDKEGKPHIVSTSRSHSGGYHFDIKDDKRKEYARECGKLSRKYKIDFEDVIRLGTDKNVLKRYKEQLNGAVEKINKLSKKEVTYYSHELFDCGRDRRQAALIALGVTVPSESYVDVNHMSFSQLGKAFDAKEKQLEQQKIKKRIEAAKAKEAKNPDNRNPVVYSTKNENDSSKVSVGALLLKAYKDKDISKK